MNDRLYRSRDDRILAGVAAGVADRLDLDPALVRVLWVVLTPLTGGFLLLLYVVMAFVVPEEPDELAFGRWSTPSPSSSSGPTMSAPPTSGASAMSSESSPPPSPSTAGQEQAAGSPSAAATPADADSAPAAGPVPGWVPPSSTDLPSTRQSERERRRAERWARRAERRGRHDPTGGLIFGALLILLGAFFLARTYLPDIDWDRLWPIAIIAIGVLLLASSVRRTPSGPAPGP